MLIAFLDRSDSYHSLFLRLFASPPPLVTSALVIAEGHGWFLRRYDRNRAMQFLQFIHDLPDFSVRPFDSHELPAVKSVLARFADQNLTLADAHGLVIMRERKNMLCLSTDRHMSLTGVRLAITPERVQ